MAAGGVFESGHLDMVHDAQLDYYGKRLATCSSDRTIKVFDLSGDQRTHIADLKGHEGPVWTVCWAHPRYGSLLASASFDHRVILWKEGSDGQWMQVSSWQQARRHLLHAGSCAICTAAASVHSGECFHPYGLFSYSAFDYAFHQHATFPLLCACAAQVYKTPSNLHTASVNSIAFAPHELGLVLACASSDGTVSLLEHKPDGSWDTSKVCIVFVVC
jgi:protein transport protein SEC13